MIYAMSDLHGCYEKYIAMLDTIQFSEQDTLYVLGDVVDRGNGGIRLLQDMQSRPNVVPLRGNHDCMAYRMLSALINDCMGDSDRFLQLYELWLHDGGAPTYEAFAALTPAQQAQILTYLNSFLIYDEIAVGGNTFFLTHTVPEKERMLRFDKLLWQEFIAGEPDYDQEYYPDKYLVTGHTPTGLIDPACAGRIFRRNRHIAIDCGAVFGKSLGCICLDTLEEFYV